MSRYPPIGDHALLGDARTAVLVDGAGAVSWMCEPRFDAPPVFASLLDADHGGRFRLGPHVWTDRRRRYVDGTPLLETTFTCDGGVVRVRVHVPVAEEAAKGRQAWPDARLLLAARCLEGEVELELVCDPRPDFGRRRVRTRRAGALGWWFEWGDTLAALATEFRVEPSRGGGVRGTVRLAAGETARASLSFTHGLPGILPPLGPEADRVEGASRAWWSAWLDRMDYRGEYPDAVRVSALALKLLTFAPSGAVVAAPTTSLPEAPGGTRNWDYRYCWLRDASWTYRALSDLGYGEEASAFFDWLLHATRRTHPGVGVLYDVYGRSPRAEREIPGVEGYRGARPVRVGNGARDQFQLDVYGELLVTAHHHVKRGGGIDASEGALLNAVGAEVAKRWREPDQGIWEFRGAPGRHTHSVAMAWAGLDRLARLREAGIVSGAAEPLRREAETIRAVVCDEGTDPEDGGFRSLLGGGGSDASLLQLPLLGLVDPDDPRAAATHDRVRHDLDREGLLLRYPPGSDDFDSAEGAFGLCSCWEVEYLARRGSLDEARDRFERLLSCANDLGLLSEEIDPETDGALGNFPQAFTHVGVINAALALEGEDP